MNVQINYFIIHKWGFCLKEWLKKPKPLTFYKCLVFNNEFQLCLRSQRQLQWYFAIIFLLNLLALIIFRSLFFILLRIHGQPIRLPCLLLKKEKSHLFFLSDGTDLLINKTDLLIEIFKQRSICDFHVWDTHLAFLERENVAKD